MPNWVNNDLTVQGNDVKVQALIEQVRQPYETHHPSSVYSVGGGKWEEVAATQTRKCEFSLWNIVSPEDLQAYYNEKDTPIPDGATPQQVADAITHNFANGNGWYSWNVRNWGTKWDVADTKVDISEGQVTYNFDTAWSPPVEAIVTLSKQHPDLHFSLAYEEEQGWGGQMEIKNGEIISSSEYEAPDWSDEPVTPLDSLQEAPIL
jgi:hypothetical protein